jgi:hypothetical protein
MEEHLIQKAIAEKVDEVVLSTPSYDALSVKLVQAIMEFKRLISPQALEAFLDIEEIWSQQSAEIQTHIAQTFYRMGISDKRLIKSKLILAKKKQAIPKG